MGGECEESSDRGRGRGTGDGDADVGELSEEWLHLNVECVYDARRQLPGRVQCAPTYSSSA